MNSAKVVKTSDHMYAYCDTHRCLDSVLPCKKPKRPKKYLELSHAQPQKLGLACKALSKLNEACCGYDLPIITASTCQPKHVLNDNSYKLTGLIGQRPSGYIYLDCLGSQRHWARYAGYGIGQALIRSHTHQQDSS